MDNTQNLIDYIYSSFLFLDTTSNYEKHNKVLTKVLLLINKMKLNEIKLYRTYDGFKFPLNEQLTIKLLGDFNKLDGFTYESPTSNFRCFLVRNNNKVIYQEI